MNQYSFVQEISFIDTAKNTGKYGAIGAGIGGIGGAIRGVSRVHNKTKDDIILYLKHKVVDLEAQGRSIEAEKTKILIKQIMEMSDVDFTKFKWKRYFPSAIARGLTRGAIVGSTVGFAKSVF